MRKCFHCEKEKPEDEFGAGRSYCRECRHKLDNARYREQLKASLVLTCSHSSEFFVGEKGRWGRCIRCKKVVAVRLPNRVMKPNRSETNEAMQIDPTAPDAPRPYLVSAAAAPVPSTQKVAGGRRRPSTSPPDFSAHSADSLEDLTRDRKHLRQIVVETMVVPGVSLKDVFDSPKSDEDAVLMIEDAQHVLSERATRLRRRLVTQEA